MTNVQIIATFGAVCSVVALVVSLVVSRKREARLKAKLAHNETDRKKQKRRDRQDNLGNRVYNALETACSLNPSGKMRVERLVNSGDLGYSIMVGYQDDKAATFGGLSYRGYPVLRVDVNTEGSYEVSVSWAKYPDREDYICYHMNIDGFESGPELQIMASRMAAYSLQPA